VITLREPVTIGEDETVSTIRFAVDAPEAFAIALHQTLTPTVVPGTR
jgi:hypothetical protein